MNRDTTIRSALALLVGLSLGALSQPVVAKSPRAKGSGAARTLAASPRNNRSSTFNHNSLQRVSGSGVPGRTLNRVSGSGVPGRTLSRVAGTQRFPTIGLQPADRNVTFPVPTRSLIPTIVPTRPAAPKLPNLEVFGEIPQVRLPRGERSAPPPPQLPDTPVILQQAPPEIIPYGDDNPPPPTNRPPLYPLDPTSLPWLPPLGPIGGTSPASLPPAEGYSPAPLVDTATEPLATTPVDLELLDVRFVDPGFSSRKLGPRYRVTLKNNSGVAIETPFQVTLAADNSRHPTATAKFTTKQIDRIEGGGVKPVDIRLPFEALEMGRDDKQQPAPFSTLFAIVDSQENLVETDEQNNTMVLNRNEVQEVGPQMFRTDETTVRAGSTIIVLGEGFGPKAGKMKMEMAGLKFEAEIVEWHHLGLRIKLPHLPLSKAVDMKCTLVREDGRSTEPISLKMEPAEGSS